MSAKTRLIYLAVWAVVTIIVHVLMGVGATLATAAFCALLYLALTWPVRSVPLHSLALLFFAGLLVVSHATVLLQFAVKWLLLPPTWSNEGRFWGSDVLAPVSEEIMKLLPVALILLWRRRRGATLFGATDLMLCGLMVGIGFNLFEDVVKGAAKLAGITPAGPMIAGTPLVPWAEVQSARGRPEIVYLGHAAGTAFMALALGWSRYLRGTWRYVPVAVAWALMTWSHALYNGITDIERTSLVWITAPLTQITPYVFLIAVIGTIIFEWLRLCDRVPAAEQSYRQRLAQARPGFPNGLTWLERFWGWLLCHDLLRQIGYARLRLHAEPGARRFVEAHVPGVMAELEARLAR